MWMIELRCEKPWEKKKTNQKSFFVVAHVGWFAGEHQWSLFIPLFQKASTLLTKFMLEDKINSVDLIRGIKKRIMLKSPRVQYLALVLLETVVKNCEKAFSEVAAKRVLDVMVKLIDDPQTVVNNRNKALMMMEAWGESSNGQKHPFCQYFKD
ncbi:unnamed protein product [Ilex paraguariensis]|uniref:VHS domain-containing protein n=1 Tax=Ilex paraguariensis TaxID=185542 RepID=A0ABC8R8P6_9AQUA